MTISVVIVVTFSEYVSNFLVLYFCPFSWKDNHHLISSTRPISVVQWNWCGSSAAGKSVSALSPRLRGGKRATFLLPLKIFVSWTRCKRSGKFRLFALLIRAVSTYVGNASENLMTSYLSHPEDRHFCSGSMKSRSGSRVGDSGSFLQMISYHNFCPDRNTNFLKNLRIAFRIKLSGWLR